MLGHAATAAPLVRLRELTVLFTGDADSTGYAHPWLVAEACRLMVPRPSSVERVRQHFYGTPDRNELPSRAAAEAIDEGWLAYADGKQIPAAAGHRDTGDECGCGGCR